MFEGIFRPMHLVLLFIIIMLLFPKKIGELGKGLGESIAGLRDALKGHADKADAASDKTP